ncbi:c6 zinc finger domain containing protein [Diplocarpon rosae]|nr:c6 zinc finger domain containing protein [Diplocarpon rosae]
MPLKGPYMALDPALTSQPIASVSPSTVQDVGMYLSGPEPVVSQVSESAHDDSPSPKYTETRSPSIGESSSRSTTLPNLDNQVSSPPFFVSPRDDLPDVTSYEISPKRMRVRQGHDTGPFCDQSMRPPKSGSFRGNYSPAYIYTAGYVNSPLTPGSETGDDIYRSYSARSSPHLSQDSSDLRRLSVNSLLSGPPGIPAPRSNPELQDWSVQYQDTSLDSTVWGLDRGFRDLDIRKNDDTNAISGLSPMANRDHSRHTPGENGEADSVEFGSGMEKSSSAFASGNYYDKPVSIRIPNSFGELPEKLRENPMNILYFHHFINHTAGCVLPQMALQDYNLLNLLLAYSALHRARLLGQPEPELRIALWVQDIFPNLRKALSDPNQIITNANLATAIMLASLEIISPKSFGVEVPWQNHLDTARQMIAARGGPQNVHTASRGDRVLAFLWSWFAYLDVLGSLSGVKTNSSTLSWILDSEIDDENDYQIDCTLGFTSKCVRLLANVAELSRICDSERIDSYHEIIPGWKPSENMVDRAENLEHELMKSRRHLFKPCRHMQSWGEAAFQRYSVEMSATNEAFHWAGLVHLHRRILGKSTKHRDVQTAVGEIFGVLNKLRRGSSAEACLLFPMFTAGCNTEDARRRNDILDRVKGMEMVGLTQVLKARSLMERVWKTGKPWETLVDGEFFG